MKPAKFINKQSFKIIKTVKKKRKKFIIKL